jgi:hypothetical protein
LQKENKKEIQKDKMVWREGCGMEERKNKQRYK